MGIGEAVKTPCLNNSPVTEGYVGSLGWSVSLERHMQRKTDMNFGMQVVTSFVSVSLTILAKELENQRLDVLGVQEVTYKKYQVPFLSPNCPYIIKAVKKRRRTYNSSGVTSFKKVLYRNHTKKISPSHSFLKASKVILSSYEGQH